MPNGMPDISQEPYQLPSIIQCKPPLYVTISQKSLTDAVDADCIDMGQ